MKQNKPVTGKKVIGYTWVPKARRWQVYIHFNSTATSKLEWFDTEEEARKRTEELKVEVKA